MACHESESVLRCSFCRKDESDGRRLISNPGDYPRAYICDECIAICVRVLKDDGIAVGTREH